MDFINKQQQQGPVLLLFGSRSRGPTMTDEEKPPTPELNPQNVIRVETAMSRYPVHRLAKQGDTSIEIRDQSEDGETIIKWEVSPNSRYGHPGPLAYKIDTLIVNRRIEEASRPIPKIIKLGTLRDICHELGVGTGESVNNVKNALRQNASAFITAKFCYKGNDGSERSLEADFTRYSVVFTGEKLPNGRKANAVYIVLNEVFMQVLNGAQTRPLDYEYLKDLNPASQRLYEILSYRMYAAIRNNRPYAKLSYAEFCTYAPLARHDDWKSVSWQMSRIHAPHKESGYIANVEFDEVFDNDGKYDWIMSYIPGEKAREEYRRFSQQGGPRTLHIDLPSQALPSPTQAPSSAAILPGLDFDEIVPSPLEQQLIIRGISKRTAAQLVERYPVARIEAQIERFDWLKSKDPKSIARNDGGFLAEAIRNDYPMPKDFESAADREKRLEEERIRKQQERDSVLNARNARQRAAETDRKVSSRWEAMSAEDRLKFELEALAAVDDDIRRSYEKSPPKFQRAFLERIRHAHLCLVIEQEEAGRKNR
jgi:hypothetical protein